jgi:hypothetical protein
LGLVNAVAVVEVYAVVGSETEALVGFGACCSDVIWIVIHSGGAVGVADVGEFGGEEDFRAVACAFEPSGLWLVEEVLGVESRRIWGEK